MSGGVEADDAPEDEGPLLPWVEPDDRLWRHPSEIGAALPARPAPPVPGPRSSGTRTWSVAVVAGVVGAIIASGIGVAAGNFQRRTTLVQPVTRMMMTPTSMSLASGSPSMPNWPAVADSIAPSVVSITTSGSSGNQTGSGVLYTSIGDTSYILTAARLIGDGRIQVTFDDSESQYARLVGIDPQTGVGLVSVRGTPRIFPPFSYESNLQVAEPVLGVGAHSSMSDGSAVTSGSISAFDVALNVGDNATMEDLVAVNTSGAAANAGGPLVDARGAVFGIEAVVDSPDSSSAGKTYAIPMDVAGHLASEMLAGQPLTHPWLGTVDSTDPSTATVRQLRLSGGAQVTEVTPGSPARQAGLAPSDIITSFDGKPVQSTGALTHLMANGEPGRPATISYVHRGKPVSTTVTLTETPSDVELNQG